MVHGVGFAATLVSGFALAHREAVANGFPDNIHTYALISSLWTATFALGAFVGPSIAGVLVSEAISDNYHIGILILQFLFFRLTISRSVGRPFS